MKINHDARQERHQRIGLHKQQSPLGRKKGRSFFKKIILIAVFISLVKILNLHFSYYNENSFVFSVPDIQNQTIALDEDGFVSKKSIQTQKRDTTNQHEIIIHKIHEGETLGQIGLDYQIKLATILTANPDLNPWKPLVIGTELKILPVDGIAITLTEDQDIDQIATKYKIDKDKIVKQNALKEEEGKTLLVSSGTTLILPGASPSRNIKLTYGSGNKAPTNPSLFNYDGPVSPYLIFPTVGKITQYYHSGHYALDIASAGKGPIFAAADGVVIDARPSGWNGGYGNMVVIDHGKGMTTLYAHNEKLYVKAGDVVKQGQTISWMGNTGRVRGVTGIHLHFEVIVDGVKRNPLAYIK